MKIIRVFPRRTNFTPTDDMAFVGYPPMIRPEADEVHVSCVFTWDKDLAISLCAAWGEYYKKSIVDGPGFNHPTDGFTPGMYVKAGVTFTSRGCNNQCPWCYVPKREGTIRELEIKEGYIIQDNNFLQCNLDHRQKVYDMLRKQSGIEFSGGLEAKILTQFDADNLKSLRIKQLFFACDSPSRFKYLENVTKLLGDLGRDKLRCFVMIGFNETIDEAKERLENVWNAGFMPFAQLYRTDTLIKYSQEWRDLQRTWQRPAAMRFIHKMVGVI